MNRNPLMTCLSYLMSKPCSLFEIWQVSLLVVCVAKHKVGVCVFLGCRLYEQVFPPFRAMMNIKACDIEALSPLSLNPLAMISMYDISIS